MRNQKPFSLDLQNFNWHRTFSPLALDKLGLWVSPTRFLHYKPNSCEVKKLFSSDKMKMWIICGEALQISSTLSWAIKLIRETVKMLTKCNFQSYARSLNYYQLLSCPNEVECTLKFRNRNRTKNLRDASLLRYPLC